MVGEGDAHSPWLYGYKLYTTEVLHHGRGRRGSFTMAIGLEVIHHGNYTPWSGKARHIHHDNMAISYTPRHLQTMIGKAWWPIHQGNMAISYTPRQLYTMVEEGVAHSTWQYGHEDRNRSMETRVKSVLVFQC